MYGSRHSSGSSVRTTAPAKVNLFLGVGALREDGFHDVVTVLHALELADVVTVMPADRLHVRVSPDLGIPESDNLAWCAAARMAEELGAPSEVEIAIDKRIPHGAGLGGGSSDAAAVIAALCRLAGISPREPAVVDVARSIGADVPFFLSGPAALMGGRGDILLRSLPPLTLPVTLVKPAEPVDTAAAYRAFDLDPRPAASVGPLVESMESGTLDLDALSNNLEDAAVALVPATGEALAWASVTKGVLAARVSGSGSAVFAICCDDIAANDVAREAAARGWWSCATRTASEGATVTRTEDGE